MKPTFSGKVAVVTSGAGGIGAAVAADLQESGVSVAILDKKSDPNTEASDGRRYYCGDITDADFVADSVQRVSDELGPPHYLLNTTSYEALVEVGDLDVLFVTPWLANETLRAGRQLPGDKRVIYHHKPNEQVPDCKNCLVPRQGDGFELPMEN